MLGLAKNQNQNIEELCSALHFETLVGDARDTNFEDASFDLICSNNTFEHIYVDVLKNILKEFNRILKPEGVMSHFIDMSDHFSHLDASISNFNFLKYSNAEWKFIDNSIQPQNRLRFIDYIDIYEDLNINVIKTEYRKGDLEDLKKIKLANPFKKYSIDDLLITHGYLVSASQQ